MDSKVFTDKKMVGWYKKAPVAETLTTGFLDLSTLKQTVLGDARN